MQVRYLTNEVNTEFVHLIIKLFHQLFIPLHTILCDNIFKNKKKEKPHFLLTCDKVKSASAARVCRFFKGEY